MPADSCGREFSVVEVHETESIKNINSLAAIQSILKAQGFDFSVTEKNAQLGLPEQIQSWVMREKPRFYALKANRTATDLIE